LEIEKRVVWLSPDTGEVRYGTITEVIDDVGVVIAYDDGGIAWAYVCNRSSNVSPA
jgi:ribosomal protein L35AE/L33A